MENRRGQKKKRDEIILQDGEGKESAKKELKNETSTLPGEGSSPFTNTRRSDHIGGQNIKAKWKILIIATS